MDPATVFPDPASLAAAVGETGYLADDDLATVSSLAMRLRRPLLMEGGPARAKTALAEALADALDVPLIRLQCYEGIAATQALYDWDTPPDPCVRALPGGGRRPRDVGEVGEPLRRPLPARPPGAARPARVACVLLVDEIGRADDEFEAFLLEVLSTWSVTIPELGTVVCGRHRGRAHEQSHA